MVATVLKLRYRVLGNTLARRPWQLVGFCLGALSGAGLIASLGAGMIALGSAGEIPLARNVMVLAGSLVLAGWVLGPILIAGTDETVDAAKLAPLPLSTRQVMLALAGVSLTGIPGIVTAVLSLASALVWFFWPLAMVAAVPAALLALLECVLLCRLATTLSQGLGGDRRRREIVGTLVLVLVILSGPIFIGVTSLVQSAAVGAGGMVVAIDVLGWTPLGAAWAVPADIAAGAGTFALARFAIAAATVVVLWLVWRRALEASISAPSRGGSRAAKPGALGWFGRMPTGPVGATWARSLTAWLRDPRYLRQLVFVPLLPAIFALTGSVHSFWFVASPIVVALLIGIAGYSDISYDGTAYASVLAAGGSGRADRWGRLLGAATLGIPAIVIVALVTTLAGGHPESLPAILGAALGVLLGGYAVSAVSSALLVVPVAAPGDSPFRSVPGQTFLTGILVFVIMGAAGVVAAPALGFAIAALTTGSALFGILSLASAIVVGAGLIVVGVGVGGRTLERTGPDLLQRIKAFPT